MNYERALEPIFDGVSALSIADAADLETWIVSLSMLLVPKICNGDEFEASLYFGLNHTSVFSVVT